MKIAILINTFYPGRGMDSIAELQAKELLDNGHQVSIFTFDHAFTYNNLDITELGWPKKTLLNYFYRLVFPFHFSKIHHISEKLSKYDLLIAHFYPISYLAYYSKKRYPYIKYIFYNHGLIDNKFNPPLRRLYESVLYLLMNKSISNIDCMISVSNYIDKVSKYPFVARKIIYNKINPSRFLYTPKDIRQDILDIHKKFCNNSGPIYLYVGVLSASKGIPMLIECYKQILKQYPDAKLLLAGQKSYEFNLLDYMNEETFNKIFYFGHVSSSDLGFLYSICDVYTSASTFESFNLPSLEAQLFGKPVVVFNVGAHSEVVKNYETGYIVKPFDITKFVESMITAYINKEKLGFNAKIWASKFTTDYNKYELNNFLSGLQ